MNTQTRISSGKLTSILLALVLAMVLLPAVAFAAPDSSVLTTGGKGGSQPAIPSSYSSSVLTIAGGKSAANATSINTNQTYSDNLTKSTDEDWFKVYLPEAGPLSIVFEPTFYKDGSESGRRYYQVILYDDQNQELLEQFIVVGTTPANAESTLSPVGLSRGMYYIKVKKGISGWTDKPYSIRAKFSASSSWENELNNSMATASSIALNKSYYGAMSGQYDVDWFMINIVKPGTLAITFEPTFYKTGTASSKQYYKASFYSDQNQVIWSQFVVVGATKADAVTSLPATGLSAGNYYLKIEKGFSGWTDKTYTVTTNYSISDTWESEVNDSMAVASTLNNGQTYSGTICRSDDSDWYKLALTESGPLFLDFESTFYKTGADSSRKYYLVELYDEQSALLWRQAVIVGTTKADAMTTIPTQNLSKGTYYVKVVKGYSGWTDKIYKITARYNLTSLAKAAVTFAPTKFTYDGKVKTPVPTVKLGGKTLKSGTDYKVAYKNNKNAGTATLTITGVGAYYDSISKTFTIAKAANPVKVKAKSPAVSVKKVKKANQKIATKKAFAVTKAQGKVTYKKVSGNKKITVAKNGKITVKKGLKKGTYKVKVKVTSAGNANYKAKSTAVTVKVRVK